MSPYVEATDYVNVVLQALMRVSPVRNYFLAQKAAHAAGGCSVSGFIHSSTQPPQRVI